MAALDLSATGAVTQPQLTQQQGGSNGSSASSKGGVTVSHDPNEAPPPPPSEGTGVVAPPSSSSSSSSSSKKSKKSSKASKKSKSSSSSSAKSSSSSSSSASASAAAAASSSSSSGKGVEDKGEGEWRRARLSDDKALFVHTGTMKASWKKPKELKSRGRASCDCDYCTATHETNAQVKAFFDARRQRHQNETPSVRKQKLLDYLWERSEDTWYCKRGFHMVFHLDTRLVAAAIDHQKAGLVDWPSKSAKNKKAAPKKDKSSSSSSSSTSGTKRSHSAANASASAAAPPAPPSDVPPPPSTKRARKD